MDKILYNSGVGRVLSIFFPSGKIKDGGSCCFATPKCLKYCESSKNNKKERDIFKYITERDNLEVFNKILDELKNDKFLFWFASGDCPPKYTTKIAALIKALSKRDVVQLGFTRNKELWKSLSKVDECYIVLTTEKRKDIEALRKGRVIAIPNYEYGKVDLYKNQLHGGGCGASWYEFEDIICENDCRECHHNSRGCFI